jgi:hypothetical protein
LNDFNVVFAAGKKSSVGASGKDTPNLYQHLNDLKDPPLAKKVLTQADLDTQLW